MKTVSYMKQLMQRKGLSNYALADRVGVSEGAIRNALAHGPEKFGADTAYRVAQTLGTTIEDLLKQPRLDGHSDGHDGMPLRYETGGGGWVSQDFYSHEPLGYVDVAPVKAYAHYPQWLERLKGPSINEIVPDGALLQVVDAIAMRYVPRHNDLVIVERTRDGGHERERTAKQVYLKPGTIELWPRSSDERYRSPILLNDHPEDDTVTVAIVGYIARAIIEIQ